MPNAVILVGLPASGKSTYLKQNSDEDEDLLVLSTDNIVMRMAAEAGIESYDEAWKIFIDKADKEFYASLAQAARDQRDIVIDRTNMTVKSRARLLRYLDDYDTYAMVFGINLPVMEWLRRLNNRPGKTVPFKTLSTMSASFEMPTKEEGFKDILIVP